jgi:hypothetical protein
MNMTYNYDPTQIKQRGKDQMRFELGDTMTDGGAETCALSDEEYTAMLENVKPGMIPWMWAKLYILEAILLKLSYQVNTKVDVLSYGLGDRAAHWLELYKMLYKKLMINMCVPTIAESASRKPPYFHTGMNDNPRSPNLFNFPFRTEIDIIRRKI